MLGPGNMYRTIDSSAIAVFLSDLEPQKRLDRIMELEKESGVRTKQYLATLFTNYIIIFYGAGESCYNNEAVSDGCYVSSTTNAYN